MLQPVIWQHDLGQITSFNSKDIVPGVSRLVPKATPVATDFHGLFRFLLNLVPKMGFMDEREYENNEEDEGCGRGDVHEMLQLEYIRYVFGSLSFSSSVESGWEVVELPGYQLAAKTLSDLDVSVVSGKKDDDEGDADDEDRMVIESKYDIVGILDLNVIYFLLFIFDFSLIVG
ncbi:hypothetical protein L1887_15211 [Cichorium endivia]|nr:hypothetical protein L1887_15211 [Cichorium endivia]